MPIESTPSNERVDALLRHAIAKADQPEPMTIRPFGAVTRRRRLRWWWRRTWDRIRNGPDV